MGGRLGYLVVRERPTSTVDEARDHFEALVAQDSALVDPRSRARLLLPSRRRVDRAIVLFHGLTNAPRQFLSLAERFSARGCAVYIPRIPYHGYLDRMTTDLQLLTARDLVAEAAAAVDLVAGLAEHVTVSGISLGAVLAVWAAQYRSVALAAPIAPAIGLPLLPLALTGPIFAALGRVPNRFVWWDPRKKGHLPGPPYAYPRYPTHALVETQRLGLDLLETARRTPPRARSICLISNAADMAVNNAAGRLLVKRWRRRATGTTVSTFQFPRRLKLFHDVVDPLQPYARPALVHPVLEQLIVDGTAPDPRTLH